MPEYIDKEKLIRDLIDNRSFYPAIVKNAIENAPTENVVPRSEVEKIFEEIEENLHNLIKYYKEKRRYVTEVDYSEFEQIYCDVKIRTFEERLLKIAQIKKKYIGE